MLLLIHTDTYRALSITLWHKSGSRRASATLILARLRILSKHLRLQTAQNSNTFSKLFRLCWGDPKVTIRPKKPKFQDDIFWGDNIIILKKRHFFNFSGMSHTFLQMTFPDPKCLSLSNELRTNVLSHTTKKLLQVLLKTVFWTSMNLKKWPYLTTPKVGAFGRKFLGGLF